MPEHVKYFEPDGSETHAILPDLDSSPAPSEAPANREPLRRHESWAAAATVVGVFGMTLGLIGWLVYIVVNSAC